MSKYMSGKEAGEHFGASHPGGVSREYNLDKFKVEGCYLKTPTNASTVTTATPACEFHVNLAEGMVMVNGTKLFIAAVADIDVEKSASACTIVVGESIIYTFVYFLDMAGNIERRIFAGAAAVTANVVQLTPAEIGAFFGEAVPWMAVGTVQFNHTTTDTATQAQDNTIRPWGEPDIT